MTATRTSSGTWWHVYPLGFLGAPREATDPGEPIAHVLPRLLPWWDYAAELGFEGIVLGPLFAAETHGYDTVDHLAVDRRLGAEADLIAVLDGAHERGLRVILDGVFNHVGRSFPRYQQALDEGPDSEAATWFDLDWTSGTAVPRTFEGHDHLVELDHANPEVSDYIAAVLRYWCDRGVDGWRLDAAYAVRPELWAPPLTQLREAHPGAFVFGEVIRGDYAAIVAASGMDSVTQYELWKAIGSAIDEGNFFELAHALTRHAEMLASFVPVTFLGNHDTSRIASRISDPRHLPHAIITLLVTGGTPVVYAGDEQGYTGVKYDRLGGDDEVRPPFPARPEQLSALGRPLYELHRDLMAVRAARPWLAGAPTEVSHLANTSVLLLARNGNGDEALATGLNLSDQPAVLGLPSASFAVLLGQAELSNEQLTVPPHGWVVLAAS